MSEESFTSALPDNQRTINDLPDEVLEYIFSILPPYKDLEDCRLVCKRWNKNVQNVIRHKKIYFHRAISSFSLQWESISPKTKVQSITKRYSHSACSHGNDMYVFGGCTCTSTTFNDLWKLDLSTRKWERLLTMGNYPSPKACATLVFYNNSLILFGGWTHPSPYPLHQAWRTFNELHIYDIDLNRWTCIPSPTNAPPPMAGHSATVHGDMMVVFGGLQGHTAGSNDVWYLNLVTHFWVKMETTEVKPHARYGQSQIYIDDTHLLILGGWGGPPNMVMTDVWLLTMTGRIWTWTPVTVNNLQWAASHLWCHPACRVENYVVVLSRNPVSTPPALAYSKWTSSTVGFQSSRMAAGNPEARSYPDNAAAPSFAQGSFDRDVNVNGRRGCLRVTGAPVSRNEYLNSRSPHVGHSFYSGLLAFREEAAPMHPRLRERQLEVLQMMEEKLGLLTKRANALKRLTVKPQTPKMAMFVLDISQVLSASCSVTWLQIKAVPNGSPDTTILYTLVKGNGELVMFGGIRKDANSITQSLPTMDNADTVSNSLHFITTPQDVI